MVFGEGKVISDEMTQGRGNESIFVSTLKKHAFFKLYLWYWLYCKRHWSVGVWNLEFATRKYFATITDLLQSTFLAIIFLYGGVTNITLKILSDDGQRLCLIVIFKWNHSKKSQDGGVSLKLMGWTWVHLSVSNDKIGNIPTILLHTLDAKTFMQRKCFFIVLIIRTVMPFVFGADVLYTVVSVDLSEWNI